MSGFELSLIIKHQSMQLQMDDPVRDDFYHHFWQMKGGRSQAAFANLLAAAKKGVANRKVDGVAPPAVTASLGVATVASRSKVEVVRTPRPLIQFAKPSGAQEAVEGAGDAAAATPSATPLAADRWVLVRVRLRLRLRLRVSPNLPGRRAVACTGGIPTRPST